MTECVSFLVLEMKFVFPSTHIILPIELVCGDEIVSEIVILLEWIHSTE